MKGFVMSCTVALEANNNPTLTFSFSSLLVDCGQSEEEFCGSFILAGIGETRSVGLAVEFEPDNLTVLSYKDTIVWKDPGCSCCDKLLFLPAVSVDSSRLYR